MSVPRGISLTSCGLIQLLAGLSTSALACLHLLVAAITSTAMQFPKTQYGGHPSDELEDALAGLSLGSCAKTSSGRSETFAAEELDCDTDMPLTLTQLAEKLPDLFARELLPRMDATTRAMLARASTVFRDVVASSGLHLPGGHLVLKLETFCNSVERLAWAKANGCSWTERTCALVAVAGQLEVLMWARENGCPWDERTCALAAAAGKLEILMWAREHDCPWDWETCAWAAEGGHLHILLWAQEHARSESGERVHGLHRASTWMR